MPISESACQAATLQAPQARCGVYPGRRPTRPQGARASAQASGPRHAVTAPIRAPRRLALALPFIRARDCLPPGFGRQSAAKEARMAVEWIAVDWGTSHLRAWAMGQRRALDHRESDKGMGASRPRRLRTRAPRPRRPLAFRPPDHRHRLRHGRRPAGMVRGRLSRRALHPHRCRGTDARRPPAIPGSMSDRPRPQPGPPRRRDARRGNPDRRRAAP